jgi:hypothetical protein
LAVAEADERCGFQGRSSILAPTHCLMEKWSRAMSTST